MDSDDRFVGNIKLELDDSLDQSLRDIAGRSPRAAFVHLFHPDGIGSNETISRIAWHSPEVKRLLVQL